MTWKNTDGTSARASAVERRVPSDEDLMARLQAGDHTALGILFDRYSRLVFSVAAGILRDDGEAEEVVQDTYLYLYQKPGLFDPAKGTAKSWVVQTAFHRALDRKKYLRRRGLLFGTDNRSLDDALLAEADLERETSAKLARELIKKAFRELPEMQRRTLELYYFEGLELREISEKLNQPWENVRHHFYRGLRRLRKSSIVRELREK